MSFTWSTACSLEQGYRVGFKGLRLLIVRNQVDSFRPGTSCSLGRRLELDLEDRLTGHRPKGVFVTWPVSFAGLMSPLLLVWLRESPYQ